MKLSTSAGSYSTNTCGRTTSRGRKQERQAAARHLGRWRVELGSAREAAPLLLLLPPVLVMPRWRGRRGEGRGVARRGPRARRPRLDAQRGRDARPCRSVQCHRPLHTHTRRNANRKFGLKFESEQLLNSLARTSLDTTAGHTLRTMTKAGVKRAAPEAAASDSDSEEFALAAAAALGASASQKCVAALPNSSGDRPAFPRRPLSRRATRRSLLTRAVPGGRRPSPRRRRRRCASCLRSRLRPTRSGASVRPAAAAPPAAATATVSWTTKGASS